MAYAVIKSGGKQYRVAEGQTVDVDKLDLEVGSPAVFSDIIFVGDGGSIKTGADLEGSVVTGEVVSQFLAKKVLAYKYRRRKGYHRTVGHRAKLTRVRITAISA